MDDILSGGKIDPSTSGPTPANDDDRKRDILLEQKERQEAESVGGTQPPPTVVSATPVGGAVPQVAEPFFAQDPPPLPVLSSGFDSLISSPDFREVARQATLDVVKNITINGQGPVIEGSSISFNVPQQPQASEAFIFQGIAIPQPQITAQQIDIQPISISPPRQIIDEVPEATQSTEQTRIQSPQISDSVTLLDIPEPPQEPPSQIDVSRFEPSITPETPETPQPISVETPSPVLEMEPPTPPQQTIKEPDIETVSSPEIASIATSDLPPIEEQTTTQVGAELPTTQPIPTITTQQIEPSSIPMDEGTNIQTAQEPAPTSEPITSQQAETLIVAELEKRNISPEDVSGSDVRQIAREQGFQTTQRSWSNFVDPEQIKNQLEQKEETSFKIDDIATKFGLNDAEKAKLENYYDSNNPNPPFVVFDVCVDGQLRKFIIPAYGPL